MSRRIGPAILVVSLLLTVMLVSLSVPAASAAALAADQQCSSIGGSFLDGVGTNSPAGQTFIPTESSIVSLALHLRSTSVNPTPMTASILSGGISGASVGSVDFSVPSGFGAPTGSWFTVQLPSGISVTPGSIYALNLKDNSGSSGVKWDACAAPYGNGCGYANGVCQANSWGFIEYSGDFTLGLSTTGVTIAQGSAGTVSVLLGSQANFASPVRLSLSGPQGVTGTFSANPGTAAEGADSFATTSGTTSSATLSIFVPSTVPVGTYPLTITANSGPTSHSTTLTLTVAGSGTVVAGTVPAGSPDFITQPSSGTITLNPGTTQTTTLVVTSVNDFNSEVDLSTSWLGATPSDVTVSLPTPVAVPPGGTGTSTLTLNAGGAASTGTYTLQITSSGSGIVHTSAVSVAIVGPPAVLVPPAGAPDFSTQPSSASVNLNPGGVQYVTLVLSSLNGFNSQVALSDSWVGVAPSGVSVVLPSPVTVPTSGSATSTLTLSATSSASVGVFTLLVTETSDGISHSTQLSVGIPGTSAPLVPVSGSADFTAQPTIGAVSLNPGSAQSVSVVVSSVNGFYSQVALSDSWIGAVPSGVSVTLPSPVNVPAGGSTTATLTLTATTSASVGTYTLLVTAVSGGISHSTQITVGIPNTSAAFVPVGSPDFSSQPSSASLSLGQGNTQTVSLVISSLNGFNSQVALSAAWVGATPAGVSVNLPSSVTVTPGNSATSTLTLTASSTASTGSYSLLITATGNGITHTTQLTINIPGTSAVLVPVTVAAVTVAAAPPPDFSVSPSSSTIAVTQGLSTSTNVIVNSVGGFSSPVTFSTSWIGGSPTGISLNLPQPVTPPVNSAASSSIGISASGTSSTGSFELQITGTSGSISHSSTVVLQVNSPGAACIIATATYGSAMAPQVQLLRNFRDNSIMATRAGNAFMVVFNTWYYSFSPQVANRIAGSNIARGIMQVILSPLVGILAVSSATFHATSAIPELAVLFAGLLASGMIGAFYLGLPLSLLRAKKRFRSARAGRVFERVLAATLIAAIGLFAVGELVTNASLLMISTTAIVLSTGLLGATVTSNRLVSLLKVRA